MPPPTASPIPPITQGLKPDDERRGAIVSQRACLRRLAGLAGGLRCDLVHRAGLHRHPAAAGVRDMGDRAGIGDDRSPHAQLRQTVDQAIALT